MDQFVAVVDSLLAAALAALGAFLNFLLLLFNFFIQFISALLGALHMQ